MKKTISISIAHTLFNIEEDAYIALDGYLKSVKAHFADTADKDEIIKDIEARIAERFSELSTKIVTLKDVETITADMGTVHQFDDEAAGSAGTEKGSSEHRKQLYRNPDEAVVAGVASGLAYYFGVDPLIVRIVFVAISLFNGIGVLIYIILWFTMPEAKSAAQKLEMRGDPVTLSTLSNIIKEKIEEVDVDHKSGKVRKILMIPITIVRGLVNIIQKILFPAVRIIVGSILTVGGFSVAVGSTIAAGILIFSIPLSFIVVPAAGVLHGTLFYVALLFSYFVILIPSILVFFMGLRVINRKQVLSRKVALSLFAIFVLCFIGAGITISRLAFHAHQLRQAAEQPILEQ